MDKLLNYSRKYVVPNDLPDELQSKVKSFLKLSIVRDEELSVIRDHYYGDPSIIERNFSKPASWQEETWSMVKKYLAHINTTAPSLRMLTAGCLGGGQFFNFKDQKYTKKVRDSINSEKFLSAIYTHFENAALYGTSILISNVDEDENIGYTFLNPITTYIITSPMDVYNIEYIVSFDENGRYCKVFGRNFILNLVSEKMSREGYESSYVEFNDRKVEPWTIAYGIDRRSSGNPHGLSLLRATPNINHNLTTAFFNVQFLSRVKAMSILLLKTGRGGEGNINADSLQLGVHSALVIDRDAAAAFLTNDASLEPMLRTIDLLKNLASYETGIPNNEIRTDNNSAAIAANASAPLTSQINFLSKKYSYYYQDLVLKMISSLEFFLSNQNRTLSEIQEDYDVSCQIQTYNDSNVKTVLDNLMLYDRGLKTDKELIGLYNPTISLKEIERRSEEIRLMIEKDDKEYIDKKIKNIESENIESENI